MVKVSIVERTCPVDGGKVMAMVSSNINNNVGTVCFCLERGRCTREQRYACLLQVGGESK